MKNFLKLLPGIGFPPALAEAEIKPESEIDLKKRTVRLVIESDVLSEDDVKGISDNLGFSVYLYHFKENTPMIVKDVNIYKGDTVSAKADYPTYASKYPHYVAPVTTTAAPTTPKETTKAPDTTPTPEVTTKAPAATTKAPAATTAAPKAESGCGSAVASGLALIALVSLAGVAVKKKQK